MGREAKVASVTVLARHGINRFKQIGTFGCLFFLTVTCINLLSQLVIKLNDKLYKVANMREKKWLDFNDIEIEGDGYPKKETLSVWKCTNRYGFREIVTMVGGKPRVRADRWDAFLEARTLGGKAA